MPFLFKKISAGMEELYFHLLKGVHETTEYLELFLRNLLCNECNELHNRALHISGMYKEYQKTDIGGEKADIGGGKADIDDKKADIQPVTGLGASRASELLKMLLEKEVIQAVKGHGKGKYRFIIK